MSNQVDDKRITIIIPTINRPSLERAVESVMRQTSPDYKILVVGDGMQPRIDQYSQKYRAHLIECIEAPETFSAGETRNFGVQHADTEWVGFLDDDDILMPDYVKHWQNREKDSIMLVYTMNMEGNTMPYRYILRYGNVGINFAVRTEFARNMPFINEKQEKRTEDWDFVYRIQQAQLKIEFTDYLGYYVRPELYGGPRW